MGSIEKGKKIKKWQRAVEYLINFMWFVGKMDYMVGWMDGSLVVENHFPNGKCDALVRVKDCHDKTNDLPAGWDSTCDVGAH